MSDDTSRKFTMTAPSAEAIIRDAARSGGLVSVDARSLESLRAALTSARSLLREAARTIDGLINIASSPHDLSEYSELAARCRRASEGETETP